MKRCIILPQCFWPFPTCYLFLTVDLLWNIVPKIEIASNEQFLLYHSVLKVVCWRYVVYEKGLNVCMCIRVWEAGAYIIDVSCTHNEGLGQLNPRRVLPFLLHTKYNYWQYNCLFICLLVVLGFQPFSTLVQLYKGDSSLIHDP